MTAKIYALPGANRRCHCGHIKAFPRAVTDRNPHLDAPTIVCGECFARVEHPSRWGDYATPAWPSRSEGGRSGSAPAGDEDEQDQEPVPFCQKCGLKEGIAGLALVPYYDDKDGKEQYGWCCGDCVEQIEAMNRLKSLESCIGEPPDLF